MICGFGGIKAFEGETGNCQDECDGEQKYCDRKLMLLHLYQ